MQEDITAIKEWAAIFKDPALLKKTVIRHVALHSVKIYGDIADAKAEWRAGEWYKAGLSVADLLNVAIGPIKPVYPDPVPPTVYSNQYGFDAMAVPDFVAGLVFGFTGDN